MAKGSGTTRSGGPGSPRGLSGVSEGRYLPGSGEMQLSTVEFPADLKLRELIDGGQFVNGGEYYAMNRNMDLLTFTLENGYNDAYGADGTLITVGLSRYGARETETLTNFFVEGEPFRESGGRQIYNNEDAIERHINNGMPYYVELANRRLKG